MKYQISSKGSATKPTNAEFGQIKWLEKETDLPTLIEYLENGHTYRAKMDNTLNDGHKTLVSTQVVMIDVDGKHIEHIYEIVKYFDIGLAFKDEKTIFPDKIVPIFHVKKGAAVFFADIKKREDFKNLSDYEKFIRRVAKEVAYYHHERWDGKGYPEGLKKEIGRAHV